MTAVFASLYLIASGLALAAYGIDKAAALSGAWRIPERHLHLLSLAGGWPGALIAQRIFRHKCSKPSFQRVFRAMILFNIVLVTSLMTLFTCLVVHTTH